MKFSKILCSTALVVIGSLVLVSAGQYGNHYGSNQGGALTHYGGGRCHGHGCYNRHQAQSSHGAYGPYHSYAVRPAVYGGHGLYTYRGYARHNPAPVAHYRRTRSYNSGPARHHRGGCNGYNCANAARHYGGASAHHNNHMANYNLRPVKALALIHSAPAYHQQQSHHHGGHYRVARGAYGHGNGNGNGYGHHNNQQQSYGHGHGMANGNGNGYGHGHRNGASHYGGGNNHGAGNSYGSGRGHHGAGNGGY